MAAVSLCRSWIFRPCLFCRPASSLPSRPGMDTMGPVITRSALESLTFDNQALQRLPLDGSEEPGQRTVRGACFSRVRPQPVANPRFVAVSGPALALLGLDAETVMRDPRGPEYLSGSRILPGSEPAAHCYCGHQFGNFAGQLGDGAACYLGEVPAPARPPPGELATSPCGRWEIQLKGAGLTPYSRQADGRKVLRSSIREFLCSEAMFHLGIPTTRAGSCVTSDSRVLRDVFYSGEPRSERSTVVLRIAPSFIRFGSFEIFKPEDELTGRQGPSVGRNDIRVQLLDYVIDTFYPEIQQAHAQDRVERNSAFFREVTLRTACLVAQWQCVGFCHGVLNTDNMSILGLTVDYGPFGFMDRFDPDYVCNASDSGGRYSYSAQPEVCRWNLSKLAEALAPELPPERAQAVLEEFGPEFNSHYLSIMRRKLGLLRKELPEDKQLITLLLETMHSTGADFTNTFRALSRVSIPSCATESGDGEESEGVLQQCASLGELRAAHQPRMDPRELSMILTLAQSNPRLFQFLSSKKGVSKELERIEKLSELQEVTEAELRERHGTLWTEWLHKYRARLAQEAEGVSDIEDLEAERVKVMDSTNPRFILRNYIAQNAIEAAESGNYSEVNRVLKVLESPYTEQAGLHRPGSVHQAGSSEEESSADSASAPRSCLPYDSKPPAWVSELAVT